VQEIAGFEEFEATFRLWKLLELTEIDVLSADRDRHIMFHVSPIRCLPKVIEGNDMDLLGRKKMEGR
jgi:hypothetical protein